MRNKIEFIEKATAKHGEEYNFDEFIYINSKTKGWITHNICGTRFERNPSCHIDSKGCPVCSRKLMANNMRLSTEKFIEKAKNIHGNEYDYSKVIYTGNTNKVTIIHTKCGKSFEQNPKTHLKSTVCIICSNRISRTTSKFIEDAMKIHGDEFDYSETNFIDTKSKVTIIHKLCGNKNEQTPKNHLKGRKCFHCSGRMPKNQEKFIEEAKKVHGDEYDYSKIIFVDMKTKINIIHKLCGSENQQIPSNHIRGKGCKLCAGRIPRTQEEFVKIAENIHGNIYDYTKIKYVNMKKKVKIFHIECNRHFEQTPQKHLYGQGCGLCYGNKKLTTEEFITKAKLIHGDEYDYSESIYTKSIEKVKILHIKCNRYFEQTPNSHLSGQNCSHCSPTKKKTTHEFIKTAKKVHGDDYNYDEVDYINNKTKIAIFHNKCKQMCYQAPVSHLKGFGCYHCNVSKGALYIRNFLQEKNIPFQMEKKYNDCRYKRPLAFDFYLPEIETCIEFDGIQHSEPIEIFGGIEQFRLQMKKDLIKSIYCLNNRILLYRINYNDDIEKKMNFLHEYYNHLGFKQGVNTRKWNIA